ncbi:uncharacterized protein EI90DRAFT_2911711, partial [Cantharellus anzutake]|uniref:uncharacterized protein n=1 Tax=Cantharellus anzutake TaxID=1750568 RepID=UPI0019030A54
QVDGVTRALARLLEHLHVQGHEAVVLGPQSGMTHYETHPLVGTAGIPLVLYPGLKLNFLRPKFLRIIREFQPDVIHIVEPIWLGAQVLLAMQLGWCGPMWKEDSLDRVVVASYHTNLPTYATLFGFPWAESIMWKWTRYLHSKCLLTACPSTSTGQMLSERGFSNVRIWSRGVDLQALGPHRRSEQRRRRWGIVEKTALRKRRETYVQYSPGFGFTAPITPPPSPPFGPVEYVDEVNSNDIVILYVGRISHEKNLVFLIRCYQKLLASLPTSFLNANQVKLVLVGDGPERSRLEKHCASLGLDVQFEGHLSGVPLAESYASADIFAFPSYTETFGQVVLEALASGIPVIGLDAEGTRDLVSHERTGYLLPLPSTVTPSPSWNMVFKDEKSLLYTEALLNYTDFLKSLVMDPKGLAGMRRTVGEEGTQGRTWFDAMEGMVDHYREAIQVAERRRARNDTRHEEAPRGSNNSEEHRGPDAVTASTRDRLQADVGPRRRWYDRFPCLIWLRCRICYWFDLTS